MNDLFTKGEIALILFIFVGLAGGFAADNLGRQGSISFPKEAARALPFEERQAEVVEPSIASTVKVRPSGAVDINRASKAELESLNGIGPALADRIIEDRAQNGRYERPEDLLRVKGIGPATLEKFKKQMIINQ